MVYWGAAKTARKAGPHRAAFGRTAKHQAQQHRSYRHSTGPYGALVPPLQAGSVGHPTVPLAILVPELHREGKQRAIESESRRDKRGYLFRLPGHMNIYE